MEVIKENSHSYLGSERAKTYCFIRRPSLKFTIFLSLSPTKSNTTLCFARSVNLFSSIVCLHYRADDGKSTPIKRGPGRPRKRKYFGAGSKGDKLSPVPRAGYNKEGEESQSVSEAQSPDNAVASESESLVSKESEPPKKKKKRAKQKSPTEREGRGSAPSSRGLSPVEFPVSKSGVS